MNIKNGDQITIYLHPHPNSKKVLKNILNKDDGEIKKLISLNVIK